MIPSSLWGSLDGVGFQAARMSLSLLWQSSILLVAVGMLAWFLRKRSAAVRHKLWLCALLAVPLLPLLGWAAAGIGAARAPLAVVPAYAPPEDLFPTLPEPRPFTGNVQPLAPSVAAPEPAPEAALPQRSAFDYPWAIGLLMYGAGATFMLLLVGLGRRRIGRWIVNGTVVTDPRALDAFRAAGRDLENLPQRAQRARRTEEDINGSGVLTSILRVLRALGGEKPSVPLVSPDATKQSFLKSVLRGLPVLRGEKPSVPFVLVESRAVRSSLALGILHPVILLPAGFLKELSDAELRAVAVHELAHVRRRDPAVLTLVSLLRAALFFHPLVWLGARQVSSLAEHAADDAVLAATGEPISYAKMLARLAEGLPSRALSTELAAGILFSRSAFLRRVEAILSDRRDQLRKLSRIALAATILSLLISLAVAIALPLGEKESADASAIPNSEIQAYLPALEIHNSLPHPGEENPRLPTAEEIKKLGILWPAMPPERNAALYFARALQLDPPREEMPPGSASSPILYDGNLQAFEEWIRLNGPLLEMVREGLKLDDFQYPIFIGESTGRLVWPGGFQASIRQLNRTATDAGFLCELQGDPAGAVRWYLDCMKIGLLTRRNGTATDSIVGMAFAQVSERQLAGIVASGKTPAESLRSVIAACKSAETTNAELLPAWSRSAALFEAYGRFARDAETREGDSYYAGARQYCAAVQRMLASHSYEQLLQSKDLQNLFAKELPEDIQSLSLDRWLVAQGRFDLNLRVLEIRAAIELYRRANGRLPDALDGLCPEFLPAVPIDPFSGKAMRYARTQEGWRLWSVGHDRQDDGGTSQSTPEELRRESFLHGPDYVFVSDAPSSMELRSGVRPGVVAAPADYSAMLALMDPEKTLRMPTPEEIKALGPLWPTVPPEKNGAYYLVQAGKLIASYELIPAGSSSSEMRYDGDIVSFEKWVTANKLALDTMREALRQEICVLPIFVANDGNQLVASTGLLVSMRHLARTVADAGFLAELQHRPDDAAQSYADCLRLGATLRQRAVSIQELVGIAVTSIGGGAMDRLVAGSDPSEETLRDVIRACRNTEVRDDELAAWWTSEVAYGEAVMSLGKDPRTAIVYEMWRKQRAALTEIVEKSSLPQLLQPDVRKQMQEIGTKDPAEPQDPSIPAITRTLAELGRLDVRLRSTQIRAAIKLYQAAHGGQPPNSLDALCPEILPSVPIDPFSGKAMLYTRAGEKWRVWSVGEDNVDNGGISSAPPESLRKGTDLWQGPDYVFLSNIASNIELKSEGRIKEIPPPAPVSAVNIDDVFASFFRNEKFPASIADLVTSRNYAHLDEFLRAEPSQNLVALLGAILTSDEPVDLETAFNKHMPGFPWGDTLGRGEQGRDVSRVTVDREQSACLRQLSADNSEKARALLNHVAEMRRLRLRGDIRLMATAAFDAGLAETICQEHKTQEHEARVLFEISEWSSTKLAQVIGAIVCVRDEKMYKDIRANHEKFFAARGGLADSPAPPENRKAVINAAAPPATAVLSLSAGGASPVARGPNGLISWTELDNMTEAQKAEIAAAKARTEADYIEHLPALHRAAYKGDVKEVERLLASGADIMQRNMRGYTVLHDAAQSGSIEVAKLLLSRGADANAASDAPGKTTPLAAVIWEKDDVEMAGLLVSHGVDVNKPCEEDCVPLITATRLSRTQIAGYLIRQGAKVNVSHKSLGSPLMLAAANGDDDIVALLLAQGADAKARGPFGRTAAWAAATALINGGPEAVTFMCENPGNSARNHAAIMKGRERSLKLILAAGGNINDGDDRGATPLTNAIGVVMGTDDQIKAGVELLLANGADLNAQGPKITPPIIAAVKKRKTDIVKYLMSRGADANVVDGQYGWSSLHWSIHNGGLKMMQLLLDNGAKPDVADHDGRTPLWLAASSESLEEVKLLLAHGANPQAKDNDGFTALDMAKTTKNDAIIKALKAEPIPPPAAAPENRKAVIDAANNLTLPAPAPSPEQRLEALLNQNIPAIALPGVPLQEAIEILKAQLGKEANFAIDPAVLEDKDVLIALEFKDVTLRTVLTSMLRPIGLDFVISDNAIYISTPEGCLRMKESAAAPKSLLEFRLVDDSAAKNGEAMKAPGSEETIYVMREPLLTEMDVARAGARENNVGDKDWAVYLYMTETGAEKMAKITAENRGRKLAMIFEGKVLFAPSIQSAIRNAAIITGRITQEEAQRIADKLNHAIGKRAIEEPAQPAMSAFGPAVERTVNHSGENCLIDLDTGRLFSGDIPENVVAQGAQAISAWLAEQGIDAGGGMQPEIMGLIGFDIVVFPMINEIGANDSPPRMSSGNDEDAFKTAKPGNPVYLSGKGGLPATWLFQTREGGRGILQILSFTDDPKGAKIRYKMVPAPAGGLTQKEKDEILASATELVAAIVAGDDKKCEEITGRFGKDFAVAQHMAYARKDGQFSELRLVALLAGRNEVIIGAAPIHTAFGYDQLLRINLRRKADRDEGCEDVSMASIETDAEWAARSRLVPKEGMETIVPLPSNISRLPVKLVENPVVSIIIPMDGKLDTAFGHVSLVCSVGNDGIARSARNVYDWALQASRERKLTSDELRRVEKVVLELPSTSVKVAKEQSIIIVRHANSMDKIWTFDRNDAPKRVKEILKLMGIDYSERKGKLYFDAAQADEEKPLLPVAARELGPEEVQPDGTIAPPGATPLAFPAPAAEKVTSPAWGEAVNGVRVGLRVNELTTLYPRRDAIILAVENKGKDSVTFVTVPPHEPDWTPLGKMEMVDETGQSIPARGTGNGGNKRTLAVGNSYANNGLTGTLAFDFPGPGRYKARIALQFEPSAGGKSFTAVSDWLEFEVQLTPHTPGTPMTAYDELTEAEAWDYICMRKGRAGIEEVLQRYQKVIEKYPGTKYALRATFDAGCALEYEKPVGQDRKTKTQYMQEIVNQWPDAITYETIFARAQSGSGQLDEKIALYRWLMTRTDEQKADSLRRWDIRGNSVAGLTSYIAVFLDMTGRDLADGYKRTDAERRQVIEALPNTPVAEMAARMLAKASVTEGERAANPAKD